MANGNPFYIDPLGGYDPSQGLQQVIGAIQAKSAKQKQQEQQALFQQRAAEVLASNDPNQIAEFMIQNPRAAQGIQSAFDFKNQATKKNMTDSMRRILSGADVEQVIKDRAQFVIDQGGDPADTIAELETYRADPEGYKRQTEIALSMLDPDVYKSYKSALERTKFEQGTGDMAGYAFNPDTGEFSINPELKAQLEEAKASEKLDVKIRDSINKTLTNLTSDAVAIRNTAADLDKLADIKSGPSQIAMVFKFMKALDPGSVVREGEFATAQNSAGLPDAITNTYNRLLSGERLTDSQMMEFVNTAKTLANSAVDAASNEVSGYLNTFEDTLTEDFKEKLTGRLPQRFEMTGKMSLDEARKLLEGI